MDTFKKIVYGVMIAGTLILAFFIFGSYGAGYRAGSLTKVATKGIIFKTNEGEMYIGTSVNSSNDLEASGVINNIWYFSVINDDSLMAKLNEALFNGHRVKLHYKQKFWKLIWNGDSKYIVDEIEILGTEPTMPATKN